MSFYKFSYYSAIVSAAISLGLAVANFIEGCMVWGVLMSVITPACIYMAYVSRLEIKRLKRFRDESISTDKYTE